MLTPILAVLDGVSPEQLSGLDGSIGVVLIVLAGTGLFALFLPGNALPIPAGAYSAPQSGTRTQLDATVVFIGVRLARVSRLSPWSCAADPSL